MTLRRYPSQFSVSGLKAPVFLAGAFHLLLDAAIVNCPDQRFTLRNGALVYGSVSEKRSLAMEQEAFRHRKTSTSQFAYFRGQNRHLQHPSERISYIAPLDCWSLPSSSAMSARPAR